MKRFWFGIAAFLVLAGGVFAYVRRVELRDWWIAFRAPTLPAAQPYRPPSAAPGVATGEQPSLVEGGVATSQNFMLVSSPPSVPKAASVDPFVLAGALPEEVNLAVPFTSQAPTGDWNLPYQEACEEASAIMVDAFYRGQAGKIAPDVAKKAIDHLVAFEQSTYGEYEDTSAEETAGFLRSYFKYKNVFVRPLSSVNDIRTVVANGYPVIIPVAGKLLPNPYFRNGGPLYHMLVVKGYTADRFITNDPGTRRGADYTYSFDALMKAAHDWNGGDVVHGQPMMVVVIPNPS